MILVDIGNKHAHIQTSDSTQVLPIDEAIELYNDKKVYYISVNNEYTDKLKSIRLWKNVDNLISIEGEYNGLGVDRKSLCLSRGDGIYVDAGSAITMDRVSNGKYEGGLILPGIHSYEKSYREISTRLAVDIKRDIDISVLPRSTSDGVSFGVVVPMIAILTSMANDLNLYFTGGDGEWLSKYFAGAVYDDGLVFEGMAKAIFASNIANSPNQ